MIAGGGTQPTRKMLVRCTMSAKDLRRRMNTELNHLQIFESLVLGCMDIYDSEGRRIFQDFSRSTRSPLFSTAQIVKFQKKKNAIEEAGEGGSEHGEYVRRKVIQAP